MVNWKSTRNDSTRQKKWKKKKAFIEIKILQMENINPSLSDGIGVFWELHGHHDLTVN